jgi:simple sugar transport system permease protein
MTAVDTDLTLPVTTQLWRNSRRIGSTLVAVLLAFGVGAVLIAIAGGDPLTAYRTMVEGAFGSLFDFGQLLVQAVPLLIIGLGLTVAFRGGVYNIGAEGQLFMGALAGGAVALTVPWNSPWLIPGEILAGIAGGALWGSVVGVLRARWSVNEVISSLLLNYIAVFFFSYMIRRPFSDVAASADLTSRAVPGREMLATVPRLLVHDGIFIALALVPIVGYVLKRTPFGFRIRMMGLNREAAAVAGVDTARMALWLMVISGGFAGLAGIVQLLGVEGRLDSGLSNNYGFTAIVVALLGRLTVIGTLLGSLFVAFLVVGGEAVSVDLQLPYSLVVAMEGVFVLFVLIVDRMARSS